MITFEATESLHRAAFVTRFPRPLGEWGDGRPWESFAAAAASAPVERSEDVRKAVRALLREGGHKPSGRGKPSSEYLVRAVDEGTLPSINLAVDVCNLVSWQSGLPMSVVDLARAQEPLAVRLGGDGDEYVFNASGQTIRLAGLLCLWDAAGPCANAVKDSHRTKTSEATTLTCTVIWGPASHAEQVERAAAWSIELLEAAGAEASREG